MTNQRDERGRREDDSSCEKRFDTKSRPENSKSKGYFGNEEDKSSRWFENNDPPQPSPSGDRSIDHDSPSDERTKAELSRALADSPLLDAADIIADTNEGLVVLNGSVNSEDEKQAAGDIANTVSGVRDVENRLRIFVPLTPRDRQRSPEDGTSGT